MTAWVALADARPRSAILHGSLATGDFVVGRSDIDVLIVVDLTLTDRIANGLVTSVEARFNDDVRFDLRVVSAAAATCGLSAPPVELYIANHGSGLSVERSVAREPDLVVEFWMANRLGVSLLGEPASAIIAPVADEQVLAYGLHLIERWLSLTNDDRHAELMILTSSRVWQLAELGEIGTKSAAGRWALAQDKSLRAVDGALRRRTGEDHVSIDPEDTRRLLEVARKAVQVRLGPFPRLGIDRPDPD
jgi:hypothetical protein